MRRGLNAFFSSDIGHFDVPDMTEVVPEAYELVEHGLLDEDDFRDFMFANAVRFWGEVNPDFFKGTVVERQAAEVLAKVTPDDAASREGVIDVAGVSVELRRGRQRRALADPARRARRPRLAPGLRAAGRAFRGPCAVASRLADPRARTGSSASAISPPG